MFLLFLITGTVLFLYSLFQPFAYFDRFPFGSKDLGTLIDFIRNELGLVLSIIGFVINLLRGKTNLMALLVVIGSLVFTSFHLVEIWKKRPSLSTFTYLFILFVPLSLLLLLEGVQAGCFIWMLGMNLISAAHYVDYIRKK